MIDSILSCKTLVIVNFDKAYLTSFSIVSNLSFSIINIDPITAPSTAPTICIFSSSLLKILSKSCI